MRTVSHGMSDRPYSWKTVPISSGARSHAFAKEHLAAARAQEPADALQQGGLAAAGRPTTQTNSRSATEKETSSIARVALAPAP